MTPVVYGLGVGPGDPELLTLKALRLLREAPVLAYPAPRDGASFARSIVAAHIGNAKIEYPIRMPLTAERFPAEEVYGEAARALGAHLSDGRSVAVLCQGDPVLHGSFLYLHARLAEDWHVEIVPGVSSVTACAAAAGVGLALRNDVLTVLPANLDDDALASRLYGTDGAAIMKVGRHLPRVRALLARLGLLEHALLVQHASLPQQRILRLAAGCPESAPYFSTILLHARGAPGR